MNADTEHWRALLNGTLGGVFFALIHVGLALASGQVPSRNDILRASANVALAIASGGLAAYFLTDALVTVVPLASLRDPRAVAFVIGALAWVIAPVLIEIARKRVTAKAEGVGQ